MAVLSVVLYHFDLAWFAGGYVGVDVFFVISGYLITRLILDEIHVTGAFDFRRFYVRRMRRLLPALFATLAGSLVLAILLLSPEQFQRFGRSLWAAALSCSNILFWTESGYFDIAARLKPLLHTWSLGVEEQFYLLWPLFLRGVVGRSPRRWHPYLIGTVGLASFLLNAVWVAGGFDREYRSTIFFLTPFRMFELVLGAMAIYAAPAVASRRWVQEVGMIAGLAAIGYATVAYSDGLVFPYRHALVPCVGAFLVIISGRSRLAGRVLTSSPAVGIGLISYSLYLVHWPMLVFYGHYRFGAVTRIEQVAGFALMLLAAFLMYRFIETPYRRRAPSRSRAIPQRRFAVSCAATTSAIAILGAQISGSDGWVWRDPRALTASVVAAGKQRRFDLYNAGCRIDRLADASVCHRDRPAQILVVGDSHEPDGYNAFAAIYGNDPRVNLIAFGAFNDCDVQYGDAGPYSGVEGCRERTRVLGSPEFASSLTGVVFSQNMPFHPTADVVWRAIGHLKMLNPGLGVAVIGGFLATNRDCSEIYSDRHTFSACKAPEFVAYSAFHEREGYSLPAELRGLQYLYIDRMRLLCANGTLESCVVEANGEPAFWDSHHLSLGFAVYLGERIARVYGPDLRAAGFPDP